MYTYTQATREVMAERIPYVVQLADNQLEALRGFMNEKKITVKVDTPGGKSRAKVPAVNFCTLTPQAVEADPVEWGEPNKPKARKKRKPKAKAPKVEAEAAATDYAETGTP